jgi:hypothetical protein
VRATLHMEISRQDLEKVNSVFAEFEEARRIVEETLKHLNYRTKLLDPTWEGWQLASFETDS